MMLFCYQQGRQDGRREWKGKQGRVVSMPSESRWSCSLACVQIFLPSYSIESPTSLWGSVGTLERGHSPEVRQPWDDHGDQ